jgi:anti-sigma factor RsiW
MSDHDPLSDGDRHDGEIDLRVGHPADELSALLDGELAPADRDAVRRHLDGCEPCRAELDEVAAARRAVRDLPAVAAPPGFVGGLVDQHRRADRRRAAVALMAAALALVVGVVASTSGGGEGAPAGADGDSEQVALVDRSIRPLPPAASGALTGSVGQRWDAGRPGPDVRLPSPAGGDPSGGDDEEANLDRAHEAGRGMLDLMGG